MESLAIWVSLFCGVIFIFFLYKKIKTLTGRVVRLTQHVNEITKESASTHWMISRNHEDLNIIKEALSAKDSA